jgi:hypothetical protein
MSKESNLAAVAMPGSLDFQITTLQLLDSISLPLDPIVASENLNSASLVVIAAVVGYFLAWLGMAFVWVLVLVVSI